MALEEIFLGNDTLIVLDELTDSSGVLVDTATVTASMFDVNDAEITTGGLPLTLPNVSSGRYEAVLDKSVDLTENALYELKYTAVDGQDDLECWQKLIAKRNFK
ncbi:MAG: hypothetical protein V3V24_09620 [Nitrospinaceae bacterium]